MIRSLVASGVIDADTEIILGRNFTQEKLAASFANGEPMWMDIVDPSEEEIRWLEQQLELHPTVVEDLLRVDQRPTLLVYPRYIFLSLFQPNVRLNKVEGKEIHCLIGKKFFVTVRQSDATAVDTAYNRVAQNTSTWRQGIPYFLYLITQFVIDAYYPLLDRMSMQLNQLEEALMANGKPANSARKPLYVVKQQLITLRQMVAPQREVLSNAIGEERISETADIRDLFRHLYERLLRIYDIVDAQRDLSNNVLDMIESRDSNKLAETVNRLTLLSMIFLPLTFITSLFELNFATTIDPVVLPISGAAMLFLVIGLMALSVGGMAFLFRKKGWI
ncbi:MAG: magnesium transporter CorA family protein [Anaerolineae bacterium]|nr:magnesium transporter CorA family protein [Anaerolineae bacterium]